MRPVLIWEEKLMSKLIVGVLRGGVGAISYPLHSIIYYSFSINLIKIPYKSAGKHVTSNTFGLLLVYSMASFFLLFIIYLVSENLKKE